MQSDNKFKMAINQIDLNKPVSGEKMQLNSGVKLSFLNCLIR